MTFKLYVGTNNQYVTDIAKQDDPDAYLITKENIFESHAGVAYTSLPDADTCANLSILCSTADIIVYAPPPEWDKTDRSHKKFYDTEQGALEQTILPFSLNKGKKIINCPPNTVWDTITVEQQNTILDLADRRNSDSTQLWTAGCSFTYGIGVSKEERYSALLSKELNLPLSVLAKPASSVAWARDQILRSDIRKDDIVVWGLTEWRRYPHYNQDKNTLEHIHAAYHSWFPSFNKTNSIDRLFDPSLLYQAMTSIEQVTNFCNKIGAKLILAGVLADFEMGEYLKNKHSNYIHLAYIRGRGPLRFLDISPNGLHPGALTHKYYADNILNFAKELGYV